MAAAADAALKGDAREGRDFYEAKLVTARFYADRELPMTGALRRKIEAGLGKPDGDAGGSLLARLALVDVPGPEHRDVVRALLLGREAGEVERVGELDSELAGLRPADAAEDRADADDVDGQLRARRDRNRRIRRARPSPRYCAGLISVTSPSISAIARRIRRWRGSRMH